MSTYKFTFVAELPDEYDDHHEEEDDPAHHLLLALEIAATEWFEKSPIYGDFEFEFEGLKIERKVVKWEELP
jgi:hypothetical protein